MEQWSGGRCSGSVHEGSLLELFAVFLRCAPVFPHFTNAGVMFPMHPQMMTASFDGLEMPRRFNLYFHLQSDDKSFNEMTAFLPVVDYAGDSVNSARASAYSSRSLPDLI